MKTASDILEELNSLDEHQRLEAKSGAGKSLLETICAFSNEPGMGGGTIVIGIHKNESTPQPIYSIKSISNPDKITSDIASECASIFNIPIRPTIRTEKIDNNTILIVEVSEVSNSEKPVYIKSKGLPNGAFRRIGPTDQSCTDDDLVSLFGLRGIQTYEETPLQNATIEDIDPDAIEYYRKLRANINPVAEELLWTDEELLMALSAITIHNDIIIPTLAGILLFGTRKALRRLFPMVRVDYIRINGKEWVENPDERFSTTDMRGPLLQLVQRVQNQIFEDLPKAFSLQDGHTQAESITLPSKVLREAIVNALMHASYRVHQPIQILRYNNRLEIRNPGYSLKNDDQLGDPGSRPRNPKIAAVFHETNLAETKGSGIRTMRKLMEDNGFAPPTFESDRENDMFTARLLLHHFLTPLDIEWLHTLGVNNLSDAQKKALIFVRESGAINNQTYRQLCAVDTLTASNELRHLCDSHLLEKKGKSRATFYIAKSFSMTNTTPLNRHMPEENRHMPEENRHMPEENRHMLEENRHMPEENRHMSNLPNLLIEEIQNLGKKPRVGKVKQTIIKLCQWKELSASEIAVLLGRKDQGRLVRDLLSPLIADKKIEYAIPESPKHPYQKYKAISTYEQNKNT